MTDELFLVLLRTLYLEYDEDRHFWAPRLVRAFESEDAARAYLDALEARSVCPPPPISPFGRFSWVSPGTALDGFDAWAREQAVEGEVGEVQRYAPTQVTARPRLGIELGCDIRSILWATGYRPDFSWLDLPVFDRRGVLRHDRGIVADAPGLVVLGLPFLRRRKSSFIHGAEDDVRELAAHLVDHLDRGAGRMRARAHGAGALC